MSETREVPIFPILVGSSNNRFSATSRYFNSPQSPIIFGSVCSVLPRRRSSCRVERDASSSGSVSKRLWDASSFRRPAWRKEEEGGARRKEGGKKEEEGEGRRRKEDGEGGGRNHEYYRSSRDWNSYDGMYTRITIKQLCT
jgi:hypothetical protein